MTRDFDAIEALGKASNVEKVHSLQHYLYFPSKVAAQRVAKIFGDQGFTVEYRLGADGINWLVLAKHQIVPTIAAVINVRALCERIAANHGGEYDGWEAEIPARANDAC